MAKHVLFVCSGNTCRSPMAEYLFNDAATKAGSNNFTASSAGVNADEWQPANKLAVKVMQEVGIDMSKHSSRIVTKSIVDSADMIICMTEDHKHGVLKKFSEAESKCFLLKEFLNSADGNNDVKDPYFGDVYDYRQTRNEIMSTIKPLMEYLSSHENQHRK